MARKLPLLHNAISDFHLEYVLTIDEVDELLGKRGDVHLDHHRLLNLASPGKSGGICALRIGRGRAGTSANDTALSFDADHRGDRAKPAARAWAIGPGRTIPVNPSPSGVRANNRIECCNAPDSLPIETKPAGGPRHCCGRGLVAPSSYSEISLTYSYSASLRCLAWVTT